MADGKRPLALTEGRLMVQLNNIIDVQAPAAEREHGLSERSLMKIQDAINSFLDRERSDLIWFTQQREQG